MQKPFFCLWKLLTTSRLGMMSDLKLLCVVYVILVMNRHPVLSVQYVHGSNSQVKSLLWFYCFGLWPTANVENTPKTDSVICVLLMLKAAVDALLIRELVNRRVSRASSQDFVSLPPENLLIKRLSCNVSKFWWSDLIL